MFARFGRAGLLAAAALAALGLGLSAPGLSYSTSFVDVAALAGAQNLAGLGDPLNPPPPPPLTPNVTWPEYVALMHMWGGVAIDDFDRDGDPDMYLTNGDAGPSALLRNDGNWTFTEAAAAAGVAKTGRSMGAAFGDFDNDGCRDLFVASFTGPSSLFRNSCDGTFTNATAAANLSVNVRAGGVAWGDFDRDGFLDLSVACYLVCPNLLFHNRGDGTFEDATASAGVGDPGWTFQPVFFDFDADGDLDLWDVNDFGQDRLYRNNDDGTFTDVTAVLGVDRQGAGGMGGAVGDIDNDGRLDFLVSNYYNDSLYRNTGAGFVESSGGSPLHDFLVGWGADFFDAENDGDLDLLVGNGFIFEQTHSRFQDDKFFENLGAGAFRNSSAALGGPFGGVTHGLATADFDLDGDLDAFLFQLDQPSALLRNDGEKGAWIKVDLEGTASNRDAVGARVTLEAGGRTITRALLAGGSYLSQDDHVLHFGLGGASLIDRLVIEWPSGAREELRNLSVNATVALAEPPLLIACAGGDLAARPGIAADLGAACTTDPLDVSFPTGANFTWTVDLGGTSVQVYGEAANYTFTASGAYKVTLTVRDSLGNLDEDLLVVYVRDERAPTARAGADQSVCDSETARLDAGNSTDNDPTFAIFGNFTWSVPLPSGPLTLYGARVSLRVPVPGTFSITMTATDPSRNSASDDLVLTVLDCTAPSVVLPAAVYLNEGETAVLSPTVSDASPSFPAGASFLWTFENGSGTEARAGANLTYRYTVPGAWRAEVRVLDAAGNGATASTTVVVADSTAPVVAVPGRLEGDEGSLIRLEAVTAIDNDPTFPATGTFEWVVQTVGPGGAPLALHLFGAAPSLRLDVPGTFPVDLLVSDRAGNRANASGLLVVRDTTAPSAHAGASREVRAGSTVALEAAASDNDPSFASTGSYRWSFTYGGRRVELSGPQSSFRFEAPGSYIVSLTVTDASGNLATDHLDLLVVSAAADPWPATQRALAAGALIAVALLGVPFWRRARLRALAEAAKEEEP